MTLWKKECNLRTKLFWKDILITKSKDIPWRIKCRRLVDHVYAVFSFGSENWSWTLQTCERIKGWEAKIVFRLRQKRRNMGRLFSKSLQNGQQEMDPDGIALPVLSNKHVHLRTARVSTLKLHMIERCNLLLKHTQIMCQMVPKHVLFMKA